MDDFDIVADAFKLKLSAIISEMKDNPNEFDGEDKVTIAHAVWERLRETKV